MAETCLNMGPSSVACGAHTVGATTVTVRPPKGPQGGGASDARTISPVVSHPCSRAAAVFKAGRATVAKSYFAYLFR